jgi:hypothetical protein
MNLRCAYCGWVVSAIARKTAFKDGVLDLKALSEEGLLVKSSAGWWHLL